MKSVIKRVKNIVAILAVVMLAVGFSVAPVYAVPIVFSLSSGGTVSYGGGATPFITENGAVTSVTNGGTTVFITGGDLDFATGNYSGGSVTASGFENNYAAGGSVTISGDIGSGTDTLLTGEFSDISTFSCCSGPLSAFNGILDVTYVNASLALSLGFNLPPTGGSLAQVEILLAPLPGGAGLAFNGTQMGGAVNVADSVPVPEPTTLLLLGSGLAGLGILGRLRKKSD